VGATRSSSAGLRLRRRTWAPGEVAVVGGEAELEVLEVLRGDEDVDAASDAEVDGLGVVVEEDVGG